MAPHTRPYANILETIGWTPLIRLKRVTQDIRTHVYVKHVITLNSELHNRTTAPVMREQTEGKITHVWCASGTGGTVSGAGRFLKEKNPRVLVVDDTATTEIYTEYARTHRKTEGHPYK